MSLPQVAARTAAPARSSLRRLATLATTSSSAAPSSSSSSSSAPSRAGAGTGVSVSASASASGSSHSRKSMSHTRQVSTSASALSPLRSSQQRQASGVQSSQPQRRAVGSSTSPRKASAALAQAPASDVSFPQRFPSEPHQPRSALPPISRTEPLAYATLLPHERSTISTLLARLDLPTNDDAVAAKLIAALIDPSWTDMKDKYLRQGPRELGPALASYLTHLGSPVWQSLSAYSDNASQATLGNNLLGMLAGESLHLQYPHLPNRVLKAALSTYVGRQTLADAASELGLGAKGVVKWNRQAKVTRHSPAGVASEEYLQYVDVLAQVMRAVAALIFEVKGLAAVRGFVKSRLLTRLPLAASTNSASSANPLAPLLKFRQPRRQLVLLCDKHNLGAPLSRLLAETGRLSGSPVFGVGVYLGTRKVGEGWGSAIKMAEYRAQEDALRRVYLAGPNAILEEEDLPSSTLDTTYSGSASPSLASSGTTALETSSALRSASKSARSSQSQLVAKDIWSVGSEPSVADAPKVYKPRPLGESEILHEADR